jgi:hypothetical protein
MLKYLNPLEHRVPTIATQLYGVVRDKSLRITALETEQDLEECIKMLYSHSAENIPKYKEKKG